MLYIYILLLFMWIHFWTHKNIISLNWIHCSLSLYNSSVNTCTLRIVIMAVGRADCNLRVGKFLILKINFILKRAGNHSYQILLQRFICVSFIFDFILYALPIFFLLAWLLSLASTTFLLCCSVAVLFL